VRYAFSDTSLPDCDGKEFNTTESLKNEIRSVIDELKQKWLQPESSNLTDILLDEWNKYGRCFNLTAESYFRQALDLAAKIDLLGLLKGGPHTSAPHQQIWEHDQLVKTLEQHFKPNSFVIGCNKGNETVQILTDITICYDRNNDLKYTQCTGEVPSCQNTTIILEAEESSGKGSGHMVSASSLSLSLLICWTLSYAFFLIGK